MKEDLKHENCLLAEHLERLYPDQPTATRVYTYFTLHPEEGIFKGRVWDPCSRNGCATTFYVNDHNMRLRVEEFCDRLGLERGGLSRYPQNNWADNFDWMGSEKWKNVEREAKEEREKKERAASETEEKRWFYAMFEMDLTDLYVTIEAHEHNRSSTVIGYCGTHSSRRGMVEPEEVERIKAFCKKNDIEVSLGRSSVPLHALRDEMCAPGGLLYVDERKFWRTVEREEEEWSSSSQTRKRSEVQRELDSAGGGHYCGYIAFAEKNSGRAMWPSTVEQILSLREYSPTNGFQAAFPFSNLDVVDEDEFWKAMDRREEGR